MTEKPYYYDRALDKIKNRETGDDYWFLCDIADLLNGQDKTIKELEEENAELRQELGSFEQVSFTDLCDKSRTVLYMKKENVGDSEWLIFINQMFQNIKDIIIIHWILFYPFGGYGYFIIHIISRKGLVQEGGTDHIRWGLKILGHAVIRRILLFGLWNQKMRGEYGENLIGDRNDWKTIYNWRNVYPYK